MEKTEPTSLDIKAVEKLARGIAKEVRKVMVGKTELLHKALVALLANGHVLIEGVPGIAKTYFSKAFASSLGCSFKRIQFLPDLLPSDIVGVNVFNPKDASFMFKKGPVFANIVLADEINRASPKTQSALLEAMEEHQVTVEGITHPLPEPFLVFATQNPIETEGIYMLPEAQVDRFFFKLNITYPTLREEEEILHRKHAGIELEHVRPVTSPEHISKLQRCIQENVHIDKDVMGYITRLVNYTRADPRVLIGASPRGSIAVLRGSKVTAVLKGRDYVIPEDAQEILFDALNHRIVLKPEYYSEGMTSKNVILDALRSTWVPK